MCARIGWLPTRCRNRNNDTRDGLFRGRDRGRGSQANSRTRDQSFLDDGFLRWPPQRVCCARTRSLHVPVRFVSASYSVNITNCMRYRTCIIHSPKGRDVVVQRTTTVSQWPGVVIVDTCFVSNEREPAVSVQIFPVNSPTSFRAPQRLGRPPYAGLSVNKLDGICGSRSFGWYAQFLVWSANVLSCKKNNNNKNKTCLVYTSIICYAVYYGTWCTRTTIEIRGHDDRSKIAGVFHSYEYQQRKSTAKHTNGYEIFVEYQCSNTTWTRIISW